MKAQAKVHFGTDGIRGTVGESPITVDFVLKLGWAAGRVFGQQNEQGKVLIGKDTRISGYMLESALEAGFSAAGFDVCLLGPMPTPAIAYLTQKLGATAGVVISASHNPYQDNGIKFFNDVGQKLTEETEKDIERLLSLPMLTAHAESLGKATRINDAATLYIDFCKQEFPDLDLTGMKIALDCANGATYHIAPALFQALGAELITLGVSPDGRNINLDCGSTHPEALQEAVKSHHAHLGIAFDGDGDRVLMVDENGVIIDGDELLYIMAKFMHDQGTLKGGVVGTLMSNLVLELAIKNMGLEFVRTQVGDKYVLAALQENNWILGGESSGHLIQMRRQPTGDGIMSALQVLEVLQTTKLTLRQALTGLQKFPQVMINVPVKCQQDPMLQPEIAQAVADLEASFNGEGRVLLRRSGTEPLVRVMVEGKDPVRVQTACEALAGVVKKCLVCDKQHALI
jgi:phosphoglucosamine mutase